MSTVSRRDFQSTFEHGIDLGDADLNRRIQGTGVDMAALRRADANGDGVLSGRAELDRAFDLVDRVDSNGSGTSFDIAGRAGAVLDALLEGKRPTPYHGVAIAQAARDRVVSDGRDYSQSRAPTSPLPTLSGNTQPGVTQPAWLQNQNKCNQFVGDALTQAQLRAPLVTMSDGTNHYARAEIWPAREDLFDRITSPNDVRVGDVIMRDDPSSQGTSTAHIEIVTGLNPTRLTGAHFAGAYETQSDWLAGASYDPANRSFRDSGGNDVYILRPHSRMQP